MYEYIYIYVAIELSGKDVASSSRVYASQAEIISNCSVKVTS